MAMMVSRHKRGERDRKLVRVGQPTSPEAALQQMVKQAPPLPHDALERAAKVAARLPERLRPMALRIIAGKLAHDFALRFLLLLDEILPGRSPHEVSDNIEIDLNDPRQAQVARQLLDTWSQLPSCIQIRDLKSFSRLANITSGLQRIIESADPESRQSWVFDAGSQYHCRLMDAGVIPTSTLTLYSWQDEAGKVSNVAVREYKLTSATTEPRAKSWLSSSQGIRVGEPKVSETSVLEVS